MAKKDRQEYYRKWREENKERLREYKRRYNAEWKRKNPERAKEIQAKYRENKRQKEIKGGKNEKDNTDNP